MTDPERGDIVRVDWLDIAEDPVGNPDKATLYHRTSWGVYWDRRMDRATEVIITTTTIDKDGPEQQGYCIYPVACVRGITVVKRARRCGKQATA